MKGEEGSGGLVPPPPEASGMKRSQTKWKLLLLFDVSDFFSFEASLFLFSFNRVSRKSRNVIFFKTKPDYQMVRPKKNA